jgi:hypothetical protein
VKTHQDDPLAGAIRQSLQASRTDCPDAETIAAYAERSLATADQRNVEVHLSNCARCRETLLVMSRAEENGTVTFLQGTKKGGSPLYRWPWLAAAAAAAVVLVVWRALPPSVIQPETPATQVAAPAVPDADRSAEQSAANKAPIEADQAKSKSLPAKPQPAVPAAGTAAAPSAAAQEGVAQQGKPADAHRDEQKLEEVAGRRASAQAPAEAPPPAATPPPGPGQVPAPMPSEGASARELSADKLVQLNASIQGPELESFLRTAAVSEVRTVAQSPTKLLRLTLQLEGVRRDAAWSANDPSPSGGLVLSDGRRGAVVDTYRRDCAAYELDKLLGLGMVPATIERVISGERGSVTLWIENSITEQERRERNLLPPDSEQWRRQVFRMRMFDALIDDQDSGTTLITNDWQLRLIGHARSFGTNASLRAPDGLQRFSRSLLEALARLNEPTLRERLGQFITVPEIQALLKRRDLILQHAKQLASVRGESVYFP